MPEYLVILDPFAEEAKKLVEDSPPVDSLPPEIVERAVARVGWSSKDMIVEPNLEAVRADALSFYLMCQAVAAVSYPYSRETRLISDATRKTIKYRMYDLFKRGYEDLCIRAVQRSLKLMVLEGEGEGVKIAGVEIPKEDRFKIRDLCLAEDGIKTVDDRLLPHYLPKYAIRWTELAPILKRGRTKLTKLYLVKGWAVITPRDLWNIFADLMSARVEEYVATVYEKFSETRAQPKTLIRVGGRISSLLPREPEVRERFARWPGRLIPEFFPPCVKKALSGVEHGDRNYAITVLLTAFLSYTRISPSGKAATRIADFIKDISVVRDEIVGPIFEAAERCNPPLFSDQPHEKANIYYHLGFGMTTEPRLEDSGKSPWYRPPNCQKIWTTAPLLCEPDEVCKRIKNPLTYYYLKRSERVETR